MVLIKKREMVKKELYKKNKKIKRERIDKYICIHHIYHDGRQNKLSQDSKGKRGRKSIHS